MAERFILQAKERENKRGNSSQIHLEPCPFCGMEDGPKVKNQGNKDWFIECCCGANSFGPTPSKSRSSAAKRWNKQVVRDSARECAQGLRNSTTLLTECFHRIRCQYSGKLPELKKCKCENCATANKIDAEYRRFSNILSKMRSWIGFKPEIPIENTVFHPSPVKTDS